MALCEGVQRGLRSNAYDVGRWACPRLLDPHSQSWCCSCRIHMTLQVHGGITPCTFYAHVHCSTLRALSKTRHRRRKGRRKLLVLLQYGKEVCAALVIPFVKCCHITVKGDHGRHRSAAVSSRLPRCVVLRCTSCPFLRVGYASRGDEGRPPEPAFVPVLCSVEHICGATRFPIGTPFAHLSSRTKGASMARVA